MIGSCCLIRLARTHAKGKRKTIMALFSEAAASYSFLVIGERRSVLE